MVRPEHEQGLEAERDERQWQGQFARWRESGLSQSEYCREQGLSRHQFRYWRRKLEPGQIKRRHRQASGFVPVQVSASSGPSGLSLRLPNGMVVHGIEAGNMELVKRLVEQL